MVYPQSGYYAKSVQYSLKKAYTVSLGRIGK